MKRRSSSTVTPASPLAAHAALPPGARPLVWGTRPSPDARLVISGVPGVWAFYGHCEYGKQRAIELVAHGERGQLWAHQAQRVIAPVEWVYVDVADEAEVQS